MISVYDKSHVYGLFPADETARAPVEVDKACRFIPTIHARVFPHHRLVDLAVKASASRAEDPGFESGLRRDFYGSSPTSDLKIGTPGATLPGAWRYRVSALTGWPGVSVLSLADRKTLIYNFCLSVAARKLV